MILLVDDNRELAYAFQLILQSRKFETAVSNSGEEALDYLSRNKTPELILLDYSMPYMNGEEFLEALQSKLPTVLVKSKVVGLSSFNPENPSLRKFIDMVDEFAEKPSDIQGFIDLVKKYVPPAAEN